MAVGGAGLKHLHAEALFGVGGVALQTADVDGTVDAAAGAGLLAVAFGGADAGADGAEGVVLADGLGSAFNVSQADAADKAVGSGAGRAGSGAGRVMAEHAALGLFHDGNRSVSFFDFFCGDKPLGTYR